MYILLKNNFCRQSIYNQITYHNMCMLPSAHLFTMGMRKPQYASKSIYIYIYIYIYVYIYIYIGRYHACTTSDKLGYSGMITLLALTLLRRLQQHGCSTCTCLCIRNAVQRSRLCIRNAEQRSRLCIRNAVQRSRLCIRNAVQRSRLCIRNAVQCSRLCIRNAVQRSRLCIRSVVNAHLSGKLRNTQRERAYLNVKLAFERVLAGGTSNSHHGGLASICMRMCLYTA